MAPRTISSTWKHFERLARKIDSANGEDPDMREQLDTLVEKVNASKLVGSLASLFVRPYPGMEEVEVAFMCPNGQPYSRSITFFDAEAQTIRVNPVEVVRFYRECVEASEKLATPAARKSFFSYRYQAYLSELSKLPTQYLLFMVLLHEVARASRICRVEKKGGEIETPEGERYMTLLWAFKELEQFYNANTGMNLRAEFGILWHESDWIVGR